MYDSEPVASLLGDNCLIDQTGQAALAVRGHARCHLFIEHALEEFVGNGAKVERLSGPTSRSAPTHTTNPHLIEDDPNLLCYRFQRLLLARIILITQFT